jgi:ribose transport system substrate-binding protein
MKKLSAIFLMSFLVAIFMTGCGGNNVETPKPSADASNDKNKYTICLVTMDKDTDAYFKFVDEGCKNALKEHDNINYKVINPKERKAESQGECIDKAVAEGANALLVSAVSKTGINENLKKAAEAGVKIIYVDSSADYEALMTLETDNEQAGKIAGQTMLKALSDAGITEGTVGVGAVNAEEQNSDLRDKGFRSAFEGTNFVIAPTIYIGSESLKDKENEFSNYVGFFAVNQVITFDLNEQIKNQDTKQIIITFDADEPTLALIKEGKIYATIKQNPEIMGYEGLKTAVQALEGTFTDKNVKKDTGVEVITKDKL